MLDAMLTAAIAMQKLTLRRLPWLLLRECANMAMLSRRAEDWITSPQIPSHLLEGNAKLHCVRRAADCGE